MTKKDIIDYVMQSPYNTNPAVLKSLLNELEGGSGEDSEVFVVHFDSDEEEDEDGGER